MTNLETFESNLKKLDALKEEIEGGNTWAEKEFKELLDVTEISEEFSEDFLGFENCQKLNPYLDYWYKGKNF